MPASEMMAFIYTFVPILVGDLISHDEVWNFYVCVGKIGDIVMASSVHRECVLFSEHHEMCCRLFNDTLKPKHRMVHYALILKSCGTLFDLSAFKLE